MTRATLGTTNRAETTKPVVRLIEMVEFQFPSGTLRYCTSDRDVEDLTGVIWTMSKVLSGIEGISEHSDLKSRRIAFKLSGLDETILAKLMQDAIAYAPAKVYWGFCGENGRLLATQYQICDDLLMSNPVITLDAGTGEAELSCENWDLFGNRDSAVLATPETQRLRFAGDTGMDKVADILTRVVEWGGRAQQPGIGGGGGFSGGANSLTVGGFGEYPMANRVS